MATKVDVPVTGNQVDLTDPKDAGVSMATLVIGFVLFFVAAGLGQDYAESITDYLSRILPGSNASDGNAIQVV